MLGHACSAASAGPWRGSSRSSTVVSVSVVAEELPVVPTWSAVPEQLKVKSWLGVWEGIYGRDLYIYIYIYICGKWEKGITMAIVRVSI